MPKVDATQVSVKGWTDQQRQEHTYDYQKALKREDTATIWMRLDIMLNEIRRSQKDKYDVIPLIRGTYNSQVHSNRK